MARSDASEGALEQALRALGRARAALDADLGTAPAAVPDVSLALRQARVALGEVDLEATPANEREVRGELQALESLLRRRLARTTGWWLRLGAVLCVAATALIVVALRRAGATTTEVWRAVYFQNMTFQGTRVEQHYPRLQLDWGRGQVHPRMRSTRMTARFDTCLELQHEADVLLWLEAKDGARLEVDGRELINTWKNNALSRATHRLTLAAGTHPLVISFYNLAGSGRIVVQVSVNGGPLMPLDARFARLPRAGSLRSCQLPQATDRAAAVDATTATY